MAGLIRKLLFVPIATAALFVVLVPATASPPADRFDRATGGPSLVVGGGLSNRPYATGDGRRMK